MQLGGEIKDGHLTFKNPKDEETFRKHLQNLNGGNVKLSVAVGNSVDNAENLRDNAGNNLTDTQKQTLFDTIKKHIEKHISDQIKNGVSESEIVKEINSTHSSHRARILGDYQASLRQLENNSKDKEFKRLTVERINHVNGLTETEIDSVYKKMVDNLRESVNYAGVLYREIALDRQENSGQRDKFLLHTWQDAERHIAEREGIKLSRSNNEIITNHSLQGGFSNAKSSKAKGKAEIESFVNPKDLNAQQKNLAEIGRSFGTPIIFFKGSENLNGIHSDGLTYINVDSPINPKWIFEHESYHWLTNLNPELHEEILKAVKITDEQLAEKRKDRPELSDEELDEEIIADAFSDTAERAKLFQDIGKKNKTLLAKIISWLKSAYEKFTGFFKSKQITQGEKFSKDRVENLLTPKQQDAMYKTFVKNIRSYRDKNGNRIFRVSNYTGDVEYANGDKLPQTDLQLFAENSVDNAENLGDNANRKINDYLTVTKDGAFKAKLFNEVPLNGEETSQERIKRRENEVANMDKELNLTENPDAYAQLLSDKSIKDIKNHRHTLGDSWTRTLGHYRRMYQEILENNNKKITEKRIVEQLYTLKGAIRYAERQGNITGRNQFTVEDRLDNGRDTREARQTGGKIESSRTATGNRITDTSHSENNQGGFSNVKFSISNNNTPNFFERAKNKLYEKLGVNGNEKIITDEDAKKAKREEQYALIDEWIKNPTKENKKKLKGIPRGVIQARMNGEEYVTEIGFLDYVMSSPSRIAKRVATLRPFVTMGDRAMDKEISLRDKWNKKYSDAKDLLKNKSESEKLDAILWEGDLNETEYGELTQEEINKINAENPYNSTRKLKQARIKNFAKKPTKPKP